MSEPKFTPTTESEYAKLPQVFRDADEDQIYPLKVEGVEERFNYAPNPSFEHGGGQKISVINEITNPSFEGSTDGSTEIYRNIVGNPRGKVSTPELVDVRTNLVNRSLVAGNSSTIVQLDADPSGKWCIATPGSYDGGQFRFPVPTAMLTNGSGYTFSIELYNPHDTPVDVDIQWGTSGTPTELTIAPKQTLRSSSTGVELIYLGSNSAGFITFDNGTKSIYFRRALIEKAGAMLEYFDGSTGVSDSDLTPKWKGEPNASVSSLTAPRVKGWEGVNGVVYWSKSIGRAKLFVPFAGTAGARAQSVETVGVDPVTAMARPHTNDGTPWLAKYDGAYPYPGFRDPAGNTITELQYPVVGGAEPPVNSRVGQYWVNNQNTPYRRIQ